MKKLSYGLLISFLLYLVANYVFLNRTSESRALVEENLNKAEMATAHALSEQARADGVFSNATLKIENESPSFVTVKIIKVMDNSEFLLFILNAGSSKEVPIVTGEYYLKLKYYNGKQVHYQRGDNFNIEDNSKTTITLKEVIFGNYGTSSLSAESF